MFQHSRGCKPKGSPGWTECRGNIYSAKWDKGRREGGKLEGGNSNYPKTKNSPGGMSGGRVSLVTVSPVRRVPPLLEESFIPGGRVIRSCRRRKKEEKKEGTKQRFG